ncbi:hypothetical protein L3D22_09570 [Lysobacter soli]|uniref:hypothetical protein n=1 Tax=Lysobacter soli TaxID=453783 RepID=UPI00209F5A42|nr:hypothetical protein [Lysobacter soli]UTA52656.1 hypothetical protein L3D22_09570 [Lysobacter soli]
MRRHFRAIAYSLIAVLAALALFGGESPADTTVAAPVRVHANKSNARAERAPEGELPSLRQRGSEAFPVALFAADAMVPTAPAIAPPAPAPPIEAPSADLKVLGWMQSGAVPFVFVEWNGTSYTLRQTEIVEEQYRFDEIGGGFASFTYLPTGESRRYAVSDPALME